MTADQGSNQKIGRNWGKVLLPIVVSIGILTYIAANYQIGSIWAKVEELSIVTVLIALGLLLTNLAFGIGRLKFLLSYFGAHNIPAYECSRAFVAGLLSSIFILNLVGNVVGRFALLRRQGVDVATVTALVFTEKLLLAVSGLVLVIFGWIEVFGSAELYDALDQAALPEAALAICLVAATTISVFNWKREKQLIGRLVSAAAVMRILGMLSLTLAAQLLMALTYAVLADRIIGADAPPLVTLFAVGAIVSFAAAMPVSVNGWGIREIASIFALGELGVAGPEAVAISVTLGVLATVSVLLSSVLLLKPSSEPAGTPEAQTRPRVRVGTENHAPTLTANTIVLLVAGPLTVLMLFFSMHIPLQGTVISLNLGDPIALLGLVLFLLNWTTSKRLPANLPKYFVYWMIALTLLLVLGFVNGVARIGVTDWALNNRLIGWTVIVGYVAIGAMCVSHLGLHSLRRMAEVIIIGGVVITLFDLAHRQYAMALGSFDFIGSNFEGFSRNRNAFALQLLIGLVALIAYARPFAKKVHPALLSFLLFAITLGIWRTYSLSGLSSLVLFFAIALAFRMISWRVFGMALLWGAAFLAVVNTVAYVLVNSAVSTVAVYTPEANLIVSGSTSERMLTIRKGLEMWLAHPIIGEGLGAFANRLFGEHGSQLVIHSVPVWLLAEFGIVGLIVGMSLPVAVVFKQVKTFSRKRHPAFLLTLGLLLLFALFSLVHDIAYQRLFWLLAGACAAASVKLSATKKVQS